MIFRIKNDEYFLRPTVDTQLLFKTDVKSEAN